MATKINKNFNVYMLRTGFKESMERVNNIEELLSLVIVMADKIKNHNTEYNDNLTSEVLFASEITIAKNYPLKTIEPNVESSNNPNK